MDIHYNTTIVVDINDHQTLHGFAVAIADHSARSEIELYAEQTIDAQGRRLYDTTQPREESVDEVSLSLTAIAARYIELRGNALPFRMHRTGAHVWFEDANTGTSVAKQLRG